MMFKKTPIRVLVALSLLILMFGYSCSDDFDKTRALKYDCLDETLSSMEKTLNDATIGDEDGMYPKDAAEKLSLAIANLKVGISKRNAGLFVLQHEVESYCNSANSAITAFADSKIITLLPGDLGQLFVAGIDKKSYIDFGSSADYGKHSTFTVEAWLKYSGDANSYTNGIADFIAIFQQQDNVFKGWMLNFMGDKFRLSVGLGPEGGKLLEGAGNLKIYNKWVHVVAIYDQSLTSSQMKMYINGEIFFTKSNDVYGSNGALQTYQTPSDYRMWAFQQPTDQNRCMSGYIKNFRLWNSAKTEDQIKSLMTSEVSGTEADLICAWDFTVVPEDNQNIKDKTGKYTAKIVGTHTWRPIE